MFIKFIVDIQKKITNVCKKNPDRFLKYVSGVIHVGANIGQERELYAKLGIRVLWIEPIPEVFEKLVENLASFPKQRAIQCLVTDEDDVSQDFYLANNDGASSSIFDFNEHRDIWPDVKFIGKIKLKTLTLASVFKRYGINPADYQALLLDTQGSELLVLKGSISILSGFLFVKTEVADFESYKNCCQLPEIEDFMITHGYKEISRTKFASRSQGGNYYDIVYKRVI